MSTAKQSLSGIEDLLFVVKDYVPTGLVGLQDAPSSYLGHSGDYLVVNDGESGIHFTGIEKIAADLTDYGFGGGSSDIPKYTNLPDPTENDGKIVASGCDLYYGCDGEWKKIGADAIPPPENVPGCVSNLEEYNQYQEYKEQFLADNLNNSFSNGFLGLGDPSELIYDVCLFSDSDLSSVKIDETTYKWGMFANTQTVNITATPGVASDREIQFSHWAGNGAVFGDANSSQTTLLVDKDLSVTGYFSEILEGTCEDVILHAQSPTQKNLASTAEIFQLGSDTIIDNTNTLFGESSYQTTSDPVTVTDMSVTSHLAGTQDFTFETWFRTTDRDADLQGIFEEREVTRNRSLLNWTYRGTQILGITTGYFSFDLSNGDGPTSAYNNWVWTIASTSPVQIENNTWYHLAIVRRNVDNWAFYVNGTPGQVQLMAGDGNSYGSFSGSVPVFSGPTKLFGFEGFGTVARNFQDFRITKKAIYTTNFTPPNSLLNNPCPVQPACEDIALHVQSNTTDASTTFTDSSSNTHAITRFGDTQHKTANAYLGSTSMVFDGAGDYLQVGDTTTFKFLHDASTDYTIEGWFYLDSSIPTSTELYRIIGNVINGSRDVAFDLWYNKGWLGYYIHRGVVSTVHRGVAAPPGAFVEDQWNHVAVVYTINNQPKIYLNGQDTHALPGTDYPSPVGSPSTSNSTSRMTIGAVAPGGGLGEGNWWPGRMQDIRISKRAVYTGDFDPPNSLLNNPCCEDIALHVQSNTTDASTTFTDSSSNTHAITRFGDTQHSTTNAHLGTTSMKFDGTGDVLKLTNIDLTDISTSNFTCEFWFNTPALRNSTNTAGGSSPRLITDGVNLADRGLGIKLDDNKLRIDLSQSPTGGQTSGNHWELKDFSVAINTWYHVALVRNNDRLYVYINGIKYYINGLGGVASQVNLEYLDCGKLFISNYLCIGGITESIGTYQGHIQDLRISKKAIYTSDFTPPNSLLNNPC